MIGVFRTLVTRSVASVTGHFMCTRAWRWCRENEVRYYQNRQSRFSTGIDDRRKQNSASIERSIGLQSMFDMIAYVFEPLAIPRPQGRAYVTFSVLRHCVHTYDPASFSLLLNHETSDDDPPSVCHSQKIDRGTSNASNPQLNCESIATIPSLI